MSATVITSSELTLYGSKLEQLADALRAGALVIFPTETVYGIAASAAHPEATARLRHVKGRSDSQPFTVHIGARSDARRYLTSPSPLVRRLARRAWPGPLTMICEEPHPERTEAARGCPAEQLREIFHDGTVGLRCPDHPVAADFLRAAQAPVVASSANRAGRPPPTDVQAALAELGDEVDYAIDAGRTRLSGSSTIVHVHGNEWSIQRAGVLDARNIGRLARSEVLFVCTGNSCRSPMAEYLFRARLAERLGVSVEKLGELGFAVTSAGTFAGVGGSASDGTLAELSRRGLDARAHRSQPLTVELIHRAERIYCMAEEHREAVLGLVPTAVDRVSLLDSGGPVPDPIGGGAADYRACADQIERAVEARVAETLDDDRDW
jgi:tRNA threonylcarbamoyl adenosine modification protein (Sua5/YciO/YrdC/YwlC family)